MAPRYLFDTQLQYIGTYDTYIKGSTRIPDSTVNSPLLPIYLTPISACYELFHEAESSPCAVSEARYYAACNRNN